MRDDPSTSSAVAQGYGETGTSDFAKASTDKPTRQAGLSVINDVEDFVKRIYCVVGVGGEPVAFFVGF